MRLILALNGLALLFTSLLSHAEEISLPYQGLTVTANLETTGKDWASQPIILMTHGTLAHNHMEIMEALQSLFKERGYNSLAINLSLGLSKRQGMYDCATPHNHRHTDAISEIGLWFDWLKSKGVPSITMLGHSRGGNQTAWYAAEHDSPLLRSIILMAPQTFDAKAASEEYQERYHTPLAPLLAKAEKMVKSGQGAQMMKDIDFIYCENTSATASSFVSYYKAEERFNTPTVMKSISKPVLVIAASEDTIVTDLEEKVAPLVASKKSVTLSTIDGADHFFRDLYAEEAVDSAVAFLKSH